MLAADLAAGNKRDLIRKAAANDVLFFQNIGADNPGRTEFLSNGHHTFETFRKDPIVSKYDFAIFAGWRNQAKRRVMTRNGA